MPILHHIQHVPFELKLPLKVRIMEDLHRNLLASPFLHSTAFDLDIITLGPVGQRDFLVQPSTIFRRENPVRDRDGDKEDQEEDEECRPAFGKRKEDALEEVRHGEIVGCEMVVVERGATLGGEGGVGYSGRVGSRDVQLT